MNSDARKHIQMSAKMDRLAAIVRDTGAQVSVSEMELVCLCSFAQVGMFSLYSCIDGETGEKAGKELDAMIEEIRKTFSIDGEDGLMRLAALTVALLGSEKFSKYDPRPGPEKNK